MKRLNECNTFNNLGKHGIYPRGYKTIKLHLIYDTKYDTIHIVKCVADGHLIEVPIDSIYSEVVLLL